MFTTTSLIAIATDLIAIAILAIPLYYRRHRRRLAPLHPRQPLARHDVGRRHPRP